MAWAFTRIWLLGVWRCLRDVDEVISPRFLCININYENIFKYLIFVFIHVFLTSYMLFLTSSMKIEFFLLVSAKNPLIPINPIRNAHKQALRISVLKGKPPYSKRLGSGGSFLWHSRILAQSFSGSSKNV